METMHKRVSKAGSITIPAQVRRELSIQPGDAIEITGDSNGNLVLGRYNIRCTFCGTTENVHELSGKGICKGCAEKAYEVLKGE